MSEVTDTDTPEVVRAEVVTDAGPIKGPGRLDDRNRVVEEAADLAVRLPGVPSKQEFLSLAMQARILSMSGAAPKAVRNNPYIAFHVAMMGRDFGISPSAALKLIDVIARDEHDPNAQLSVSPELLLGQIHRLGLGTIKPVLRTNARGVVVALEPGGVFDPRCAAPTEGGMAPVHVDGCTCRGIRGLSEFTWEDAQVAGLVDKRCPDALHHWVKSGTSGKSWNDRCDCRQGWLTYPKRMLHWRAVGYAASDWFPEASLGTYTAEELDALVDDAGRAIDPAQVALPPGYEPEEAHEPEVELLDADGQKALRERITELPGEAQGVLKGLWTEKFAALTHLPLTQVKGVEALLASIERRAEAGEWGEPAPDSPAEASETPEGTETPETSPEAATGEIPAEPADAATLVVALVAEIEALDPEEVADALGTRGRTPTGSEADDRRELALLLFAERNGQGESLFAEDGTPPAKPACALCGSSRAQLVEVRGVTRCAAAKDCSRRIEARAAEAAPQE